MKIVVAPDSFKGSLNAVEASNAIEKGIKRASREAIIEKVPLADGGEGTAETLVMATKGRQKSVYVTGPLGEKVLANYGLLGDGKTCVIEMAQASGIGLVPKEQLNPLTATTYGTGELIKHAIDDGYRDFILALGGSATNDGGAGMLQALGMRLLDDRGQEVPAGGEGLASIRQIDMESFDPRIAACRFSIASDVENPLVGPDGASYIFGPQKGATEEMVSLLDRSMKNWANQIEKVTGIHLHDYPGAGAAGGIGGAFIAFFPAVWKRGIDVVAEHTKLQYAMQDADLVITGEGKVDVQTASGKTAMGVTQAAKKLNIPTVILSGTVGSGFQALYDYGVISVMSIIDRPMSLEEAMNETASLLEKKTEQVIRMFFHEQISLEKAGGKTT
ncbi:glycerate kinase [Bacillus massiliglaciei]|uniref:glycerate kinase n=1 Tax=Bacillus massiliglaciei TaxID=1816693 RepID=UPI000A4E36F8|nr:glycerate kinase [Bacillus massiliglaciei]